MMNLQEQLWYVNFLFQSPQSSIKVGFSLLFLSKYSAAKKSIYSQSFFFLCPSSNSTITSFLILPYKIYTFLKAFDLTSIFLNDILYIKLHLKPILNIYLLPSCITSMSVIYFDYILFIFQNHKVFILLKYVC